MVPEQGVRIQGCFCCKLLYPERAKPCPECGGGLRFIAAQMMSEELITSRIRADVAECRSASEPAQRRNLVCRLLKSMFIYGPHAVQVAAEAGMDLDTLRSEYEDHEGS